MKNTQFTLWLEFEEFHPDEVWDVGKEFFNMLIKFRNRSYALSVWSYGYVQMHLDAQKAESNGFIISPDLMVETCTRDHLEIVISKLISQEGLNEDWLISA